MDGEGQREDTAHIRTLAQKAATVQNLLQDLEVALVGAGDKTSLRLVGDLKRAWRAFRDEAIHSRVAHGPSAPR